MENKKRVDQANPPTLTLQEIVSASFTWARHKWADRPSGVNTALIVVISFGVIGFLGWLTFDEYLAPGINWVATHIVLSLVAVSVPAGFVGSLFGKRGMFIALGVWMFLASTAGLCWIVVSQTGPFKVKTEKRAIVKKSVKSKQLSNDATTTVKSASIADYQGAGEEKEVLSKADQLRKQVIERAYRDFSAPGIDGKILLAQFAAKPGLTTNRLTEMFYALVAHDLHKPTSKDVKPNRWDKCMDYAAKHSDAKGRKKLEADVTAGREICEQLGVELD